MKFAFARHLAATGFLLISLTTAPASGLDAAPYKDPKRSIEERVADLLQRMTLEEKARQLDMYSGCDDLRRNEQRLDKTHVKPDAVFDPALAEKALGSLGAGSIHDLYPRAGFYNALQGWIIKSSRLGIPALFIEEGLHGYMSYGQTVFPQSVNLASTWNPDLARKTGSAIATEARACGVAMILGPALDVAQDPRWGRVEEDFGEDPFLSGALGLAYVEGMQGESLATDHTVIAEPKHFAGHGTPESGLNTAPVHLGERELRTVMLKSFEPAFREGKAMGVMAAYHDLDGVPCTANSWLFTTVLRGEWGFKGFVLSDLGAIRRLRDPHHVANSPADAVCMAINAGVDMQFYDFDHDVFQGAVLEGVKTGRISRSTLDRAASGVLRAKFMLGLFDSPFVDPVLDATVRRSAAHRELALEVARQSMCLLKNDKALLPLKRDLKRIAIVGTNANIARLGDYADVASECSEQGMCAQIRQLVSPQTRILYSDGSNLDEAVSKTKEAEVVILGLGEWNGTSGEGHDRMDLGLPGGQEALVKAVVDTGVPAILVLQNGRALSLPWVAEHVSAILEAWYSGESGGQAIAETLFGLNNPAGRLTVTFPRNVGQLPVNYNHFPSKSGNYVEGSETPLFAFGHGLSYTTFQYDQLAVTAPQRGSSEDVSVTFALSNSGRREGDEVAQLYIRKQTASVATPVKALKAFARVHLKPGESKQVAVRVKQADLAIWSANREWKIEPGDYTVTVGGSSSSTLCTRFNLD